MTALLNRLVVLLAEDDENDLLLLRRAIKRLSSIGVLVVLSNGEEVIAFLRGDGNFTRRSDSPVPDVLLLDQWMPRVTGLEVASWVRAQPRFASIPVVLISGGLSPVQKQSASRLKAACWAKEVDTPERVAAGLENAIRTAFALAPEVYFASRSAYPDVSSGLSPALDPIRVWT